ncbi:hypothetical protein BP5796_07554 [Coleophoma crateriformis]|uniref:Uncharacterized protein n=1 Tax=Coleophoma crateriformis TaxID=565419 RepID=A0A3D8RJ91_9HELO|nr:hypothetical protein BP5796_07554 [Coleophoma crateriformis]
MNDTLLIISITVAVIAIVLGAAYMTGAADPYMEKVAIWVAKAKGVAEAKKLQAQGLKEGQDFVKGELAGNQQASAIADEGLGALGGVGDKFSGGIKL